MSSTQLAWSKVVKSTWIYIRDHSLCRLCLLMVSPFCSQHVHGFRFVSDPHLQTKYLVISVWQQDKIHLRMGLSVRISIHVIFGQDDVGHQDVAGFPVAAGGIYPVHWKTRACACINDHAGHSRLTLQVSIQGVIWDRIEGDPHSWQQCQSTDASLYIYPSWNNEGDWKSRNSLCMFFDRCSS